MIVQLGNHFGKRTASSLLYFLSYVYFDIYEIMKFADSHVIYHSYSKVLKFDVLIMARFWEKKRKSTRRILFKETFKIHNF